MHSLARTITGALFLLSAGQAAHADVLFASARTAELYLPDGPGITVALDDDGSPELEFEVKKDGPVVIVYNAECAATGAAGSFVGMRIFVDSKQASPKASQVDFALCSATGGQEIYTAVSRRAYLKLKKGTHIIRVIASREGATTARLDDVSIVIKD